MIQTKSNHSRVGNDGFPAGPFEADATLVLEELRSAIAGVIEQLVPPVARSTDLKARLRLDQKLSWCTFNAATAQDPRALAGLLPGRRAMERFFAASLENGVPTSTVDSARAAFDKFERVVERYAGSRAAFEAMISSLGDAEVASSDAKHKRTAFRSTSLLWGRQARLSLGCMALRPASDPRYLDRLGVRGTMGLRRTRHGVPLHSVAVTGEFFEEGDPGDPGRVEFIDPRERGSGAVGLLQDFCSKPLPGFRERQAEGPLRSFELVSSHIGVDSEVTYFIGDIRRRCALSPMNNEGAVSLLKIVDVPQEVFIGDILLHSSIWDTQPPTVSVFASPTDGSQVLGHTNRLPLIEHAEYLGTGVDAVRTPLIPRYAEMLNYCMGRLGWNSSEFKVFRCRVEFPVLYSQIDIEFKRPAPISKGQ